MSHPLLATLCYILDGTKVLLLERNKKKNDLHRINGRANFVGLGGKMKPGETPKACIIREIREEAGLDIDPQFRGIMTFVDRRTHRQPPTETTILVFIYTAAFPQDGRMLEDCSEGTLHWVEQTQVEAYPMWKGDYAFLNKIFFSDEILELHHVYEDGTLIGPPHEPAR